jgi:hypothetical protein
MTSHAKESLRWIVISPAPSMPEWLEAIQIGAQLAGKEVRATWLDAVNDETPVEDFFVITNDAAQAQAAEAVDIVALLLDPGSAIDGIEIETGDEFPASAILASQRLAETSGLAKHHRLIRSPEIQAPGEILELYSDLAIKIPQRLRAEEDGTAKGAFANVLRDLYSNGPEHKVVSNWPVEMFSHHTSSLIGGQLGAFDLTGRPKFLVHGPYLWLPAGTWSAKVRFSVDEDACRRRFRIDWGSIEHWGEQHFTPEHAGIYEMDLTYTFEQPQPCEMRILITEGCFTGRLDLLSVTVSKD